jgi:hypothetical protein
MGIVFYLFCFPLFVGLCMKFKKRIADPDPSDPYAFGPPGSGSVSQRYPSIIKQNSKKNLDSYCFVTSFLLFVLEKLYLQKVISRKTFF